MKTEPGIVSLTYWTIKCLRSGTNKRKKQNKKTGGKQDWDGQKETVVDVSVNDCTSGEQMD